MKNIINKKDKIFVAGHNGMVGSSVLRSLHKHGYSNILTKSKKELNLLNELEVDDFFNHEKPEIVILAAAKVGGIHANNTFPANFLVENLLIQINTIKSAFKNNVKRFCFLGSSCIYPKHAKQPISEDELLSSKLEPTNEYYAIAKISGLKMCQAYANQYGFDCFSLMPSNLYGTNDNYHPLNSHVMAALIRKTILAKENSKDFIECWGTGRPKREFMHVDDLSEGLIYLLEKWKPKPSECNFINIGSNDEVTIKELIKMIIKEVNYKGNLIWDKEKPDGTPRKLLDSSKVNALGWQPKIKLQEGIRKTIKEIYETNLYKEWV